MNKDIIVVGASAGGVSALQELVAGLPQDLEASLFVVLHLHSSDPSYLREILQRRTKLPVAQANGRDPIRPGQIWVARPDYHLVVDEQDVYLTRGPKENRNRPAIDALFRTAAHAFGSRVIGVVLTGTLDDGSAGLWWIKQQGGTAVVQDPADAEFPAMPRNAISQVATDHVVPLSQMPALLSQLVLEEADVKDLPIPRELEVQTQIAKEGRALQAGIMTLGPITPYTCPECHGVLVQLKEGGVPHFRCHTGHGYSISTLLAEVTEFVEEALWSSIRAIEESALLLNELSRHAGEHAKEGWSAATFDEKAADALRHADTIRQVANEHQILSKDNITEVEPGSR
jgi:two-component system chemotaxis response regulator CheB